MSHNPTRDEMFETARRLREAGNAITRITEPGLIGNALANGDQRRFEQRIAEAKGEDPEVSMCDEHDIELDADGYCPECNA
jgi:ferric-dicitrate binding protein FerR (iron transport regulator)